MVKILFVIPTLDRCGAEKQLALLATRLPRDEFAVEVCALTRGGPYEAELRAANIPVTVIGKRLKIDPVAAWRLRRVIRQSRPDIVHTWLFAANSYGRAVARWCGVPVLVASERCADHWKGTSERIVDRWLAPATDAIIVNSQAVRRFYEAAGFDPKKLVLIPNGVAISPVSIVDRAALLAELGLPADARVLGYVGRLWPQKRVHDLIWATELIKNIKPNVFTVVVGDGPERDTLVDYTHKIAIDDRVRFVGPRDDVPRLMTIMEALVQPSEFEGMPNSIMEAMAAGLPVVASNIPGNDELVTDGESGFLVPVGDTKMLASRINRLLDEPDLSRRFGQAGQARVRDQFSVERMVASHVQRYRELMNGNGHRRLGV
jgi:glycosyltransferase involved in cell wall biosynthesis